jgi:hypothetical protein
MVVFRSDNGDLPVDAGCDGGDARQIERPVLVREASLVGDVVSLRALDRVSIKVDLELRERWQVQPHDDRG